MGEIRKFYVLLFLLLACVMLVSCEGTLFSSQNDSLDELSSVEMLVAERSKSDDSLVIFYGENQTLTFPEYPTRWTYSERNGILYRNNTPSYSRIGYITSDDTMIFGRNFDECSSGSLISDDQLFLYIADMAILAGEEEASGFLVLVTYEIGAGHNVLHEFSFDADEHIQPKRCVLGTNAEYEGIIYFSDIEEDHQVLRSLDLITGEIATLFSDDIIMAPSVSPQGELIAYTKYDGIYTYNLNTNEKHQLVEIPWGEDGDLPVSVNLRVAHFYFFVPVVSWLPSGNELGYHVASYEHDEDGRRVETNYDIYVYSFLTEKSVLFMEDVLLPYWVLP